MSSLPTFNNRRHPGTTVVVGDGVRVRVGDGVAVRWAPWKVSWKTRLPPLPLWAEARKWYFVPALAVKETRDCLPEESSLHAAETGVNAPHEPVYVARIVS